jgi:integrase/recombinase XerC
MTTSRHRLTLKERKAPMETPVELSVWFDAYIYHHQALDRSPKTVTHYQSTFKLFGKYLDSHGLVPDSRMLTNERMQHFATWLRDTPISPRRGKIQRTPVGVFGVLKDLRAFIRWLNEEGMLERVVKVPVPKLPETLFPILTDAELERIWTSKYLTGKSPLATRNRALLGLMLDTGLRRAEIESLTLASIDLEDCLLTVTGKGNKQRRVPFSSGVKHLLDDWLTIRGYEPGSLFWLKASGIRMVFRRIQEDLGLELFHPHQLRHQAATMLVRNNTDLESVRRILGHADLSTTAKYLSMSDEDLRAKHAAASPFEAMLRKQNKPLPQRRKRLSLKE